MNCLQLPIPWCISAMGLAAVIVAFIFIVTCVLLVNASRIKKDDEPFIATLKTSFFFWLSMGYVALLLVVGLFYAMYGGAKPYLLGALVPIAVPWFGAVGAVTISLAGVFYYGHSDWDRKYNYWHIGRPFFGAVLGIIAFLMFVLIVTSAGTKIPFLENPADARSKDFIIYYVLAFLVGYREQTFRELIQRVTDLILSPGQQAAELPRVVFSIGGVPKTAHDFQKVALNTIAPVTVEVENVGKGSLMAPIVRLENPTNAPFTLVSPQVGTTELEAGARLSLNVTFQPTAAGSFTARLVVAGSNLATPAAFDLRGAG